jgi:hypothetical protein
LVSVFYSKMQQQVIAEFSVLHPDLSTEFVAKCVEICDLCDITPENLMYLWEMYFDKHSLIAVPKIEYLENLKEEIMQKLEARQPTGPPTIDLAQLGAFTGF